jgi:beta-glucosidase
VSSLASAPLCLVFISAWSSEGSDRSDLHAWNQGDKLVQTVAAKCASTVVVVNSVSQLNLEAWVGWDNVSAVVWSGIPGPEYGDALVDVLFGDYNPGGKLIFTLAKNDSDYGTNITHTPDSNYTEGVFLDYRHFDAAMITPRFHFGFGLSYTTFSLADLQIAKVINQTPGNASDLHTPAYIVSLSITNTGNVQGSEVVQLYLGFPDEAAEPPKILRGFSRVYLEPGESKAVTMTMTVKDVSYWNVAMQMFTVANGGYKVYVGTSANWDDLKLQGSFTV